MNHPHMIFCRTIRTGVVLELSLLWWII